jgi:hypothetical protein
MFQRTFSLCRQLLSWSRFLGPAETSGDFSGADERRVWVRRPSNAQVTCQTTSDEDDQRYPAQVRNVSRGGISLSLDRRFEPGTLLTVELPNQGANSTYTVLVCVAHVQAQEGGKWALGCRFSRDLDDDDLLAFEAQQIQPSPPDLRTWVRFPSNTEATVQLATAMDREPWTAKVLNISANGVALLVSRPIDPGTTLSLQLKRNTADEPLTLVACVVRVEVVGESERMLGCNFIRELDDNELQALS